MKQKFLLLLTIFFGLGIIAQPPLAFAEESEADPIIEDSAADGIKNNNISISIFPAAQTIELVPGTEYSGKVQVANSGEQPFSINVFAAPYSVGGEDYEPDFDSRGTYTELFDWISFPNDTFYVEPGEAAQVEFTVTVPEDAVGGGQYAAIMARSEDSINPNASVQIISQVAGILYAHISGAEMQPEGEVVEQKIPSWLFTGPLEVSEITYNTGNVDFQVYHEITITDFFSGKELVNAETKSSTGQIIGSATQNVYPKTSRSSTLTWDGVPQLGVYRVRQKIVFLDQELVTEQTVIICPLWLIFSVIGLILLLLLWILLVIRRHKRKQPQVL